MIKIVSGTYKVAKSDKQISWDSILQDSVKNLYEDKTVDWSKMLRNDYKHKDTDGNWKGKMNWQIINWKFPYDYWIK